jgi:hypothetical protein
MTSQIGYPIKPIATIMTCVETGSGISSMISPYQKKAARVNLEGNRERLSLGGNAQEPAQVTDRMAKTCHLSKDNALLGRLSMIPLT